MSGFDGDDINVDETGSDTERRLRAKVERLEASNKVLREVLKEIGTCKYAGYAITGKQTYEKAIELVETFWRELSQRVDKARAALNNEDKPDG